MIAGFRVGQEPQALLGIEAPRDHRLAARMQHGIGIGVEPARVEQRQHGERDRIGGNPVRGADIHRVDEGHAVGDARALGQAGRAGGVHDGREVRHLLRGHLRLIGPFLNGRLVFRRAAVGGGLQPVPEAGLRLHGRGRFGKAPVVDHRLRRGVADDIVELRHGKPPVERYEHRADAEAGELYLQIVGGILGQQRHAVAGPDSQPAAQEARQAADPPVHLRIVDFAPACEIDQRGVFRPPPGMVRDPVEGLELHWRHPSQAP